MKRRFGRGRRRNAGSDDPAIDAAQWMARILERGVVAAARLDPVELEDVPPSFAALGVGEDAGGSPVAVAFAPVRGADAALAALALGAHRRAEGEREAALFAVAPDWNAADRRRLGLLSPRIAFQAIAASGLAEGGVRITAEPREESVCDPALVAGHLQQIRDREVALRALSALGGLAAKHGGALRGVGDRVDLIVLARRTASLVAEAGRVRIEVWEPERATLPLSAGEGLATALDRLEGLLRKLLNDRRLRTSEAGIRASVVPVLERASEIIASARWPLAGANGEALDFVGLDANGRVVCGAVRETLRLPGLAEILDAAGSAGPVALELARKTGRPPQGAAPRIALAASEVDRAVALTCAAIGLECVIYDVQTRRNGELALEARSLPALGESTGAPSAPVRAERPSGAAAAVAAATPATRAQPPAAPAEPAARAEPRESTARAPRAEPSDSTAPGARSARPETSSGAPAGSARFEEVSLFDLDDESAGGEGASEGEGSRRRRGRGRRRGRRGRGGEAGSTERPRSEEAEATSEEKPTGRSAGARRRRAPASEPTTDSGDDGDDDDPLIEADDDLDTLAPLAADAPDLDETEEAPGYDDDDESEDEDDAAADRARRERELRRRQRAAKPAEPPPPPRRRAAFLAHADPVSVLTAAVLARDVRLVDSFWVYPQSELMTFFRSVATDLREETPIFLVGFAAAPPVRDTIQSASLYRGRLDWFDHHEWPPEDLESLRATLGADHVHVMSGAENSLATVIGARTRRSRFSDKLVELITGRFTQHDYERWGRWWWHRAAEIAARPGERRNDIEPLLAGRPSDLARSVANVPEPPLPPELAFVSQRDFRLVHFGGFTMVVIEVPPELDLHLSARIARERYDAHISLATRPGGELVVLGGDDSRVKRGLDLGSMTQHLATKHAWIEEMADDDHVARMRVTGLHTEQGRFDELITEIAMGRSIVEG